MFTAFFTRFRVRAIILAIAAILIIRKQENRLHVVDDWYTTAIRQDKRSRSTAKKLVVFNALGKKHNLPLVEHARRTIFKPAKWDCVAFMFAKENRISDDDPHLHRLQDELGCTIVRTPGVMWGTFLQYVSPTFVSNYDHVALVLDDMFIPDQGPHAVDVNKMIRNMAKHDIQVMSPGIVGDTYKLIENAEKEGLDGCIGEVQFIETYVQLFTRDAWTCYYNMLHYSGSKGWCYDACFKSQCPDFRLGQDFSMLAWHMDRELTELPKAEILGTDLVDWKPEEPIVENGYQEIDGMKICERLGGCHIDKQNISITKIACPAS
jgi:hypothetical protein